MGKLRRNVKYFHRTFISESAFVKEEDQKSAWFLVHKSIFCAILQKLFADLQTILRMELISSKAKTLQSGPEVQLVSCLVSVSLNCFISRDPARVIPLI